MEQIHSDVQSELENDLENQLVELDQVGMSDIQISLDLDGLLVPAKISVFVNLKAGHRGIHMSRLYEIILQHVHGQKVSQLEWAQILKLFVGSQKGLSQSALLEIDYQLPLKRLSLKSGLHGHRNYLLKSKFFLDQNKSKTTSIHQQDFEILYSSTCPQSTQLAKELTKNYFADRETSDLVEWMQTAKTFVATPHAQRSRMKISLQSVATTVLHVAPWIDALETVLQTPVQTAVKKADEMEFARLNAANPMFCEDALRLVSHYIQKQMSEDPYLIAYKIETSHEESLHSHNAAGMIKSKKFLQF